MTQFETELIRAIEHGCPFCGGDNIWLQQLWLMEKEVVVGIKSDSRNRYINYGRYDEWEEVDDHNNYVFCGDCKDAKRDRAILWDDEGGWIPELQEVVKGE